MDVTTSRENVTPALTFCRLSDCSFAQTTGTNFGSKDPALRLVSVSLAFTELTMDSAGAASNPGGKRKQLPDKDSAPHQPSRHPESIAVANEIEIFNSDRQRIGVATVHADMSAVEFWEQVRTHIYNFSQFKTKHRICCSFSVQSYCHYNLMP